MSPRPLALVVAMRQELAPLLRGAKRRYRDGIEWYGLDGMVVVVGGIGAAPARRAAQLAIDDVHPEILVSAGTAGALVRELKVGDVILPQEVVDAGTGERFAAGGVNGVLVTASAVSGAPEKRELARHFAAQAVDMEAAAVAQVAQAAGIVFRAFKAISDDLEFCMPPLSRFVRDDGAFSTLGFLLYAAARPSWWPVVRQLDINNRRAALALSKAVRDFAAGFGERKREENVPQA